MRFTIAICVYNGERLLVDVLKALSTQNYPKSDYEILLVDNNSTDSTKSIYSEYASANKELSCRYILERTPGQAIARRVAIENSLGDWLLFVDDDNIINDEYLHYADNFISRITSSGIDLVTFGGVSLPPKGFELPEWFNEICSGFAIWNGGDSERELIGSERCFTAGLLLRRDIAVLCNNQKSVASGRTDRNPVGGEDLELSLKVLKMGYKRHYCPKLVFVHQVSELRIGYQSIRSLYMTFGANRLVLGSVYNPSGYNCILYSFYIIFASLCMLPIALIRAIFSRKSKMKYKCALWVYVGVFKYMKYSYGCLRSYKDI